MATQLLLQTHAGRPKPAQRDLARLQQGPILPSTAARRERLLAEFQVWIEERSGSRLEVLARQWIPTLSEWLEKYGEELYVKLRPKTDYAEVINALSGKYHWLRHALAGAWRLQRTWQLLEPPTLHPPVPFRVWQAMVSVALSWGWWRTSALLVASFCGLLRPSEYLSLRRANFRLPCDHLSGSVIFLLVDNSKTARRGPRRSHVRIDADYAVTFLERCLKGVPFSEPIWRGSYAMWRRRLDALLHSLHIPRGWCLPSSMRPGGATHFFQAWGEDVARLAWRGRWANVRMLEHYVQEVQACDKWAELHANTRNLIDAVARHFFVLLREFVPLEMTGNRGLLQQNLAALLRGSQPSPPPGL